MLKINAENKCYNCNESGHYANKCPSTKIIKDVSVMQDTDVDKTKCTRCGRYGHVQPDCEYKKHIGGFWLRKNIDINNGKAIIADDNEISEAIEFNNTDNKKVITNDIDMTFNAMQQKV